MLTKTLKATATTKFISWVAVTCPGKTIGSTWENFLLVRKPSGKPEHTTIRSMVAISAQENVIQDEKAFDPHDGAPIVLHTYHQFGRHLCEDHV